MLRIFRHIIIFGASLLIIDYIWHIIRHMIIIDIIIDIIDID